MRRHLAGLFTLLLIGVSGTLRAADLTVSAAASLTNAFTELAKLYEGANPGSRVLLNFGASGSLLQQIARGAPVDVFATADVETMDRAQKQNLVINETRANFAANALVLIAPLDARVPLDAVTDLSRADVARIGLGIPESVPAGRYAKESLEMAGLWDGLKDKYVYGQNVRQVLDYTARGEVDAGIVYLTDAEAMRNRLRVVSTLQTRSPILYPISVVKGGGNERAARKFVELVRSEQGLRVLQKYGFMPPRGRQ